MEGVRRRQGGGKGVGRGKKRGWKGWEISKRGDFRGKEDRKKEIKGGKGNGKRKKKKKRKGSKRGMRGGKGWRGLERNCKECIWLSKFQLVDVLILYNIIHV